MKAENTNIPSDILSDQEIIDLYWLRNEKAIEHTDKKYGRYLYTIAYNIVHDSLDCEECVNDTYLGTWNAIPPTRPSVFQVFLSKITRNIALDRFRKIRASRRIPCELIVSLDELNECITLDTPEDQLLMSQLSEILNSYLWSLSDRQCFIFVCRYYYSDPVPKIAKMLGTSENTVYRDLAKIRKGLRERLEKENITI